MPSWDCGWYWGFGYVMQYTNNTSSHEHIDSSFLCENVVNLYDAKQLHKTSFSYVEGWKLTELFRQFYLLKEMAAFAGRERPNCHIASSVVAHGALSSWSGHINKVMIPAITEAIITILTPLRLYFLLLIILQTKVRQHLNILLDLSHILYYTKEVKGGFYEIVKCIFTSDVEAVSCTGDI